MGDLIGPCYFKLAADGVDSIEMELSLRKTLVYEESKGRDCSVSGSSCSRSSQA
jgi:hypothetical protein